MWISVIFDLPSVTANDRKNYRQMRKMLLSSGFALIQRSLFWRWVENKEVADSLIHRMQQNLPNTGNIIFLCIPDVSFKKSVHIVDGLPQKLPDPPDPWIILT